MLVKLQYVCNPINHVGQLNLMMLLSQYVVTESCHYNNTNIFHLALLPGDLQQKLLQAKPLSFSL